MRHHNILLESGTNELEIVEFYLNEVVPGQDAIYTGHYGVNVAKVLEIIRKPKITELPEVSHSSVMGAFNLRSHIISLVDLSSWLGKNTPKTELDKVIVTEFNKLTTAFLVSGVNRIHRISWQEVEPPGNYVSAFSANCITGVVKIEDRIIFILDLEKIVADINPQLGLRLDEKLDATFGESYKVIIADDSTLVREMLRDLLTKAGFKVETHTNGLDAWNRIEQFKKLSEGQGRSISDYFDLVISDIEMPKIDGHHLTKRIKEDPVLRHTPVILFSSLITDKLRHKGETVGADDQISKPEVGELARRCKVLIDTRRGVSA